MQGNHATNLALGHLFCQDNVAAPLTHLFKSQPFSGSGKTEAFLFPLFAQLSNEIARCQAPGSPHAHIYDWWGNDTWKDSCKQNRRLTRSYRVPQRGHETRPSAVRALIIYPMNALVEDQLTRLRKALDSDSTRQWYERNAGGNRIYMGFNEIIRLIVGRRTPTS